jgi:hypothetical protein
MDGNGVERCTSRAMQHFHVGALKGSGYCSFRIAEQNFHETFRRNPESSHELRTYFDGMLAAAKTGVGEAFVALDCAVKKLARSDQGKPWWIAPSTEESIQRFLRTLESCYLYNLGGEPRTCLEKLEGLAESGFVPAYHVARIVADQGCQDAARAILNMRLSIERGDPAAILEFTLATTDVDKPESQLALLEICAEFGSRPAGLLMAQIQSQRGLTTQSTDRLTRLIIDPIKEFDPFSLRFIETVVAPKAVQMQEPHFRSSGEKAYSMLADLGTPSAIHFMQLRKLNALNPSFGDGKVGPKDSQLEQAKAIGKIFYSALRGYGMAWRTLMDVHASGQLCGHQGIFSPQTTHEQRCELLNAVMLMGLLAQKYTGENVAAKQLDFIKQCMQDGSDFPPAWTRKYIDKQFAETAKHQSFLKALERYGLGLRPSDRLISEAARTDLRPDAGDYPWTPFEDAATANWTFYSGQPKTPLSRCPIPADYAPEEALLDPVCREIKRHLEAGDTDAARGAMSFDDHVVVRLTTLAVGLYHAGFKAEASELLFFVCFHLQGQYGLAHHMLTWVLHEMGRTSDALLIATDCFSATSFSQKQSTTDLVEYNLLLAELLAYLNRSGESEQVLTQLKSFLQQEGKTEDGRLNRLGEYRHLDIGTLHSLGLMGSKHANVSVCREYFEHTGEALSAITLDNMDRYRYLFPAIGKGL